MVVVYRPGRRNCGLQWAGMWAETMALVLAVTKPLIYIGCIIAQGSLSAK